MAFRPTRIKSLWFIGSNSLPFCNAANIDMATQMQLNGAGENPIGSKPEGKNSIDTVEAESDLTL